MIDRIFSALKALFFGLFTKTPARPKNIPEDQPVFGEKPWVKRARQDLGQKEIPGPDANPVIMSAWRYVNYKPPEGDETAYCSAKMCQWMEESGFPGTKKPNARSWEDWGQKVKKPYPGCVSVEWRGSPDSWTGHVCLYMGPGSKPGTYMALGANQNDEINIMERSLSKVLTFREPVSSSNSRTIKASTAAMVLSGLPGAVILDSQTQIMGISEIIKQMGVSLPSFQIMAYLLQIALLCVIVYARFQDFTNKGK